MHPDAHAALKAALYGNDFTAEPVDVTPQGEMTATATRAIWIPAGGETAGPEGQTIISTVDQFQFRRDDSLVPVRTGSTIVRTDADPVQRFVVVGAGQPRDGDSVVQVRRKP